MYYRKAENIIVEGSEGSYFELSHGIILLFDAVVLKGDYVGSVGSLCGYNRRGKVW